MDFSDGIFEVLVFLTYLNYVRSVEERNCESGVALNVPESHYPTAKSSSR